MKTCSKCKIEQPKLNFSIDKSKKEGFRNNCKSCERAYSKNYYKNNVEKIKFTKRQLCIHKNNNRIKYMKQYQKVNKDRLAIQQSNYQRRRIKTDLFFRFSRATRNLITKAFKRNKRNKFKKQVKAELLLGCTFTEFRVYLAKQFLPGMSLENHGEWHIDHIIPLASAKTQAEIEALCHYTNLQPLWAEDNLRKSSKIESE